MYFQNIRRISVAVTSSNTKSNLRKAPFPTGSVPIGNRNVAPKRHDRTLEIAMGLWEGNGEKERGRRKLILLGDGGDGEAARGPENLVLSLTRLREFLMEREVKELSLPVYDPIRGRLHPRELYALIHVIFSDTNIQVSEILQA